MSEVSPQSTAEFRGTYALIQERIDGLTEEQLVWKPAPDKWSVKEIVSHLVDSSLVHSIRIRKITAESKPPFLLYDQDGWVAGSRANETAIADILSAYASVLAYNALFYERLTPEAWGRTGWNNDKEVTLAELFQGSIRHVHIHLAQIDRTKAAYEAARAAESAVG